MKKILTLLLALLLLWSAALAEDVYIIEDVEEATLQSFGSAIEVSSSYLRVSAPELSGNAMVIISDMAGNLVYQQDYGYCTSFCSDDIYLPLFGDSTEYNVDLLVGTMVYSFLVKRVPAVFDDSWNFWDDPTQAPEGAEVSPDGTVTEYVPDADDSNDWEEDNAEDPAGADWDGSGWEDPEEPVWDGSGWEDPAEPVWDGSGWEDPG